MWASSKPLGLVDGLPTASIDRCGARCWRGQLVTHPRSIVASPMDRLVGLSVGRRLRIRRRIRAAAVAKTPVRIIIITPPTPNPTQPTTDKMVSRLLRPVLHWTQETLRVAAPALAASARGTLGAALGSVLGGRDAAAGGERRPQVWVEQRRHRWSSPKDFRNEQAVRACMGVGGACDVWGLGVGRRWILGFGFVGGRRMLHLIPGSHWVWPPSTCKQAMAFLNDGAQYEGLVKRWNNSKVRMA